VVQENIITKSFDQMQIQKLPAKARRIISSIARRHRHIARGEQLTPELATALLRMKLYQAFGPVSSEYTAAATTELIQKIQVDSPSTEFLFTIQQSAVES
jgi:hypothetical protein